MRATVTSMLLFALSALAQAENYPTESVAFSSSGEQLSGSLVFPANTKPHAAVVFIHGSGRQERSMRVAKLFAEDGIAALVYDKRGVGQSGGIYESKQSVSGDNLETLAADANAALNVLADHSELQNVPLGFAGISQAGWIAPLAARNSELAQFLVLWSGPVCKVSEEDIFSKHTADLDKQYVPSYAEALAARTTDYIWPDFLGKDTDPSEALAELSIPGLWIFGTNDGSVPVDLSIQRLQALERSGHSYQYALFSGLGHNNIPETFATVTDWIRRLTK